MQLADSVQRAIVISLSGPEKEFCLSRAVGAHIAGALFPRPATRTLGAGGRQAGGSAGGAGRCSGVSGHRHLTPALFLGDSGKRFGFAKTVRDTQRRC